MSSEKKKPAADLGRPLAVYHSAESESKGVPAFIAPPAGAPVYYGFQILHGVSVDGFTLGKITDFEAEPCEYGDAFVVAPDNSRAGLVWEVSVNHHFLEICPMEPTRWGVWDVTFRQPMTSLANAQKNLEAIIPELKSRWEQWRRTYCDE